MEEVEIWLTGTKERGEGPISVPIPPEQLSFPKKRSLVMSMLSVSGGLKLHERNRSLNKMEEK